MYPRADAWGYTDSGMANLGLWVSCGPARKSLVLNCVVVMRSSVYLRILGAAALAASLGHTAFAQAQDVEAKDAQAKEATKGLPPRAAPTDYQGQTKVGAFTLAAEFDAHGVPTPEAVYSNEDYVMVEVAFYGPADKPLKLAQSDFRCASMESPRRRSHSRGHSGA